MPAHRVATQRREIAAEERDETIVRLAADQRSDDLDRGECTGTAAVDERIEPFEQLAVAEGVAGGVDELGSEVQNGEMVSLGGGEFDGREVPCPER